MCIAAVGLSSHFYGLQKKEKEKRIAAESSLKTLTSELQLLKEKNRELAEQLRDAKRIAEELAREKEGVRTAAAGAPQAPEATGSQPPPEETTAPPPQEGASLADAVNALRLERAALTANRLKESAGGAWRAVRAAITSSACLVRSQGSPTSPDKRRLADIVEIFPPDEFGWLATEAKKSARKALGAVGSLFSRATPASPTALASPPLPRPYDSSRKITATNEEFRTELTAVRQEKRELEMQIAERTGKIPDSVGVGKVRITTGRRFSGKVLVVNQKHKFVVIDIGKNQGLEKVEVLIVHRGNKFIGKVQVIKVYDKMAAADLLMDWMQDQVQASDGVKKF